MNLAHNAVQHTVAHDSIAIGTSSTPSEARRSGCATPARGSAVEDQAPSSTGSSAGATPTAATAEVGSGSRS